MNDRVVSYLLLILISAIPYLNTLKGSFVYDDSEMVLENRNVKGNTTLQQIFFDKKVMTFSGEIYRPLRDISYRIDYLIGGKEPFVYHASNVILHIFATISAYWFLVLLFKGGSVPLMAAVIFAVHPLHTESVAWVKGRDDILFSIFYLLSFGMYIKHESVGGWKRVIYFLASISLFILSLFSKELAVTLPLTIFLYQVIFKRIRYLMLVPFIIISAAYIGLRTYVLGQVAQQGFWGGGVVPNLLTMTKGFAQYIRLSFMPVSQCADYFSFPISTGFDQAVLCSIALLSLIVICLLYSQNKFILWGGLFFFVSLLPVSNIIPIKIIIAERFLYLPLLGYCIVIASIVTMMPISNLTRKIFGLVFISVLMFVTLQRNFVWSDEYSLWSDTLKKAPSNARAHYGMGTAYAYQGRLGEAIREFKESIRLAPLYPDPFNALGLAYYKKKMVEDAALQYKKALEIDSSHRDARYNLALLYQEQGMMDEPITEYNEILQRHPDDFDSLNNLGLAYFRKGMFAEAIEQYKKVINIDPQPVGAYNNMGMVYAVMGQENEAMRWFNKALSIDPDSAETHYNLGFIYQNQEKRYEAVEAYRKAVKIRPDYNEAWERLREIQSK